MNIILSSMFELTSVQNNQLSIIEASVRNLCCLMDFSETKLFNKCQRLKHIRSKWALTINKMRK